MRGQKYTHTHNNCPSATRYNKIKNVDQNLKSARYCTVKAGIGPVHRHNIVEQVEGSSQPSQHSQNLQSSISTTEDNKSPNQPTCVPSLLNKEGTHVSLFGNLLSPVVDMDCRFLYNDILR